MRLRLLDGGVLLLRLLLSVVRHLVVVRRSLRLRFDDVY